MRGRVFDIGLRCGWEYSAALTPSQGRCRVRSGHALTARDGVQGKSDKKSVPSLTERGAGAEGGGLGLGLGLVRLRRAERSPALPLIPGPSSDPGSVPASDSGGFQIAGDRENRDPTE
ncbi:hypothetical protein chiPu_0006522 [Chiloscyllium punctatum]|uniref:Uncharacterized protein n=1 Tax=Chiloscyllium punctatum TaxID=137246 RepID=A0A401SCF9_CHIPU|nr:hypothetical protein [Chiloscyllium punctatum]